MKQGLVITSIAQAPNAALSLFAQNCIEKNIPFFMIGDTKSPAVFELPGCDFWSIQKQEKMTFGLAKILPKKNYARKNLGYLLAMLAGCDVIIESDDDNFPKEHFFAEQSMQQEAHVLENQGWVNIYKYFSDENIWPRGFPMNHLKKPTPSLDSLPVKTIQCPIQQALADENPDVDAIYRLTGPLPIYFANNKPVALANNSWCPFNTQSTSWFKPAFPLLYLPSTCGIRVTDIWKSFVAQRVAWANHWHVLFTAPTVYQERNEHDLMVDFAEEVVGYLHNERICRSLYELDLKSGEEHIQDNMMLCYKKLIALGFIKNEELRLLDRWFEDIERISRVNQAKQDTEVETT